MQFIVTLKKDSLHEAKLVEAADLRQYIRAVTKRHTTDHRQVAIWRKMDIRVEEKKTYALRGIDKHDPAQLVPALGLITNVDAGKMAHRHGKEFVRLLKEDQFTTVTIDGAVYLYMDEVQEWLTDKERA